MGNALPFTEKEKRQWAKRVLAFRAKHGLTQAMLADEMGVALRTVKNIENDACGMSSQSVLLFRQLERKYRLAEKAEEELLGMGRM